MIRVSMKLPLLGGVESHAVSVDLIGSACLECDSPLDLMQPDADDPDRFLGACGVCKRWYHIEVDVDLGQVWFIAVPNRAEIDPIEVVDVLKSARDTG